MPGPCVLLDVCLDSRPIQRLIDAQLLLLRVCYLQPFLKGTHTDTTHTHHSHTPHTHTHHTHACTDSEMSVLHSQGGVTPLGHRQYMLFLVLFFFFSSNSFSPPPAPHFIFPSFSVVTAVKGPGVCGWLSKTCMSIRKT